MAGVTGKKIFVQEIFSSYMRIKPKETILQALLYTTAEKYTTGKNSPLLETFLN